jgi:integrase
VIEGLLAAVGSDPRYATHTCHHTFATNLYRASGADREHLGHAFVKTTTIYAKVTKEEKLRAANALAKIYRESPRTGKGDARWSRRQSQCGGIQAPSGMNS